MKLLGKGSYGCVIDEYINTCNKKFNIPVVAKIFPVGKDNIINNFRWKQFNNDIIVSKKMKNYKNWKNYFALLLDYCPIEKSKENLLKNLNKNSSNCVKNITE